jgi:hypothetical protein
MQVYVGVHTPVALQVPPVHAAPVLAVQLVFVVFTHHWQAFAVLDVPFVMQVFASPGMVQPAQGAVQPGLGVHAVLLVALLHHWQVFVGLSVPFV